MYGMPPGFAEALQRKYNIMQQQADATTQNANSTAMGVNAAAALDAMRTKLMPDQVKADIAKVGAETRNIDETTRYVGPLANANIGLMGANSFQSRAAGQLNLTQRGLVGAQTGQIQQQTKTLPFGMRPDGTFGFLGGFGN
jgi:hypothetical protein